MAKTAIMIDSGCAPTDEMIKKYNLEFIGIKITLDRDVHEDGVDISHGEFYNIIKQTREFHTSPPVFGEVMQKFKSVKMKGYSELITIHFSSKMTKLVDTVRNASRMIPGLDVKVIDTESVSVGAWLIAEKIIELLMAGKTYDEVMELLPEIKKSSFMQFSVPTLKYLIKNGRIGKARGLIGTLLKKKPVLGVENGLIAPIVTVTGMEKVFLAMADNAANFIDHRPYNAKVYLTHGLERNNAFVEKAFYEIMDRFEKLGIETNRIIRGRVWPTVACHAGPEGFAVGIYGEERPIQ